MTDGSMDRQTEGWGMDGGRHSQYPYRFFFKKSMGINIKFSSA